METKFNLTLNHAGNHTASVIDTFANIEDARKALAEELEALAERINYNYFADQSKALGEIEFAEQAREDWGDDRTDRYIAALEKGMATEKPFAVESVCGSLITTGWDSFCHDTETYSIEEEEATCEPFEPGTSYPLLTMDADGNNKWCEYCDGANLVGYGKYGRFCDLPEDWQETILDNTEDKDREDIEYGEVYVNADKTAYAVLYCE